MNQFRRGCALALCASVAALGGFPTLASATPVVAITEFSSGISGNPGQIVTGPDGNLWFTELNARIGRVTPAGAVQEFSAGITAGANPADITAGSDGALWFTEATHPKIGRITIGGVVTEYGGISGNPYSIAAGPDGALWFTEDTVGGKIGRITTSGAVTEFPAPLATGSTSIVAGSDGNLWYAGSDGIVRMTTTGVSTDFNTGIGAANAPTRVTLGPDGNVWFTESSGHIGRVTPRGVLTIYTAGLSAGSEPLGIFARSDGALWFTERAGNRIGRIATSGIITEYSAGISAGAGPQEITIGPNNDLWFTESQGMRVARGVVSGGLVTGPTTTPEIRLSGPDRMGTAVAVSHVEYPTAGSAHGVVLADALNFTDALAGAPLAVALNGPMLLTGPASLNSVTEAEIKRVLPVGEVVTLLGGTAAISNAVAVRLRTDGYVVQRDAGANRFSTAVAIADLIGTPSCVFLADGISFADALSAGAAAVHVGGVVLLTDGSILPAATSGYLAAHPGRPVYAVGGVAALASPKSTPVVGSDRYATSVAVASRFFAVPTSAGLVDGFAFPDALAGDVETGSHNGPILLVAPTVLPPSVQAYLTAASKVATLDVYGGVNAVAEAVAVAAANATG